MGSISSQTVKDFELIVIDSSSNDNTVDIAKSYNAKTTVIEKSEFGHGRTRTLAAEQAKGEILVFFSQDAKPCDKVAIENLIKPIEEDNQIAASYGRQLPAPDVSVFAQHLRLFNYSEKSHVRQLSDRNKYGIEIAFISNSFAAYRRSDLASIGYFKGELIFGEDTYAAAKLLLKGKKIAYAADAKVYHSHNYSVGQEFRRYFDMGVFHRSEDWLLKKFGKVEARGVKYSKSEIAFLMEQKRLDLLPQFVLRILVKYLAYKMGQQFTYLPKHINKQFSMNKEWWEQTNRV
jgi:rhamnosyltransferase